VVDHKVGEEKLNGRGNTENQRYEQRHNSGQTVRVYEAGLDPWDGENRLTEALAYGHNLYLSSILPP
jgi:hypothetical protein